MIIIIADSFALAAAGCRLSDGRTIPDGDNFTRLDTGPCVSYLCQDGNVLPLDYSKCLYQDSLMTVSVCIKILCQKKVPLSRTSVNSKCLYQGLLSTVSAYIKILC